MSTEKTRVGADELGSNPVTQLLSLPRSPAVLWKLGMAQYTGPFSEERSGEGNQEAWHRIQKTLCLSSL